MGKGLIRQEAASFDFTSETGSVGKDTAGGEGDMIGLHWTVTTRWLQACCYSAARSFFYFCLNKKKKGEGALKEGVFADIIWMLLTLRHGDSVTEMS